MMAEIPRFTTRVVRPPVQAIQGVGASVTGTLRDLWPRRVSGLELEPGNGRPDARVLGSVPVAVGAVRARHMACHLLA
jgi:hypothetical protein